RQWRHDAKEVVDKGGTKRLVCVVHHRLRKTVQTPMLDMQGGELVSERLLVTGDFAPECIDCVRKTAIARSLVAALQRSAMAVDDARQRSDHRLTSLIT